MCKVAVGYGLMMAEAKSQANDFTKKNECVTPEYAVRREYTTSGTGQHASNGVGQDICVNAEIRWPR